MGYLNISLLFTTESASERIVKIGYYLGKLMGKSLVSCFLLTHGVYVHREN